LPEIRRGWIDDIGVERVAGVASFDLDDVLEQMPVAAVEELRRANVTQR
jgi:hypothetical protein